MFHQTLRICSIMAPCLPSSYIHPSPHFVSSATLATLQSITGNVAKVTQIVSLRRPHGSFPGVASTTSNKGAASWTHHMYNFSVMIFSEHSFYDLYFATSRYDCIVASVDATKDHDANHRYPHSSYQSIHPSVILCYNQHRVQMLEGVLVKRKTYRIDT